MIHTRRDVVKMAMVAFPMAKLAAAQLTSRPDSKFSGVQIGIIIAPHYSPEIPFRADELLPVLLHLGLSGVEMQAARVELYAGAPGVAPPSRSGSSPAAGAATRRHADAVERSAPERAEARHKSDEELKRWRLSAPMDKYRALRRTYNDAGVNIYAFRLAGVTAATSDEEFDYFFNSAQALGANQITLELPVDTNLTKRLGDYAAKRKIMLGYHNHTQVNYHSWDTALSQSKWNGINFDVGHFVAATSESPIPFIKEHHGRITSLHLKDRKFGTNGGKNMPWGQGDTPLKEILQLMKREHYPFPASIELEYPIPEGSSVQAEIARCLHFCKDALA